MIPSNFFDTDEIKDAIFIDFEYASYNARAFDIANHFCGKIFSGYNLLCSNPRVFNSIEYCGFEFDFEAKFPAQETRISFIQLYLSSWDKISVRSNNISKDFVLGFEV